MMIAPDWSKEFELMCDASDYVAGAVLGQRQDKTRHSTPFIPLAKFSMKHR